jgi:hypothetical protein
VQLLRTVALKFSTPAAPAVADPAAAWKTVWATPFTVMVPVRRAPVFFPKVNVKGVVVLPEPEAGETVSQLGLEEVAVHWQVDAARTVRVPMLPPAAPNSPSLLEVLTLQAVASGRTAPRCRAVPEVCSARSEDGRTGACFLDRTVLGSCSAGGLGAGTWA